MASRASSLGYYAITTDLLCFDHLALHGIHRLSAAQQLQAPATQTDLWCELGVPAGWLSDLLRLQWLPVLQAALLHAFGEDWDEADRGVYDFLSSGLLRHALPRQKHLYKMQAGVRFLLQQELLYALPGRILPSPGQVPGELPRGARPQRHTEGVCSQVPCRV